MTAPVDPPEPVDPAGTPAGGTPGQVLDEDAALTVDQVSDEPPEVAPGVAPGAAPVRTPAPRMVRQASGGVAPVSRRPVRMATRTTGSGLVTGEQASLDGSGMARDELLAEACVERGPRLVITGRQPDVIEGEVDPEVVAVPVVVSERGPGSKPPGSRPPASPRPPAPRAALVTGATGGASVDGPVISTRVSTPRPAVVAPPVSAARPAAAAEPVPESEVARSSTLPGARRPRAPGAATPPPAPRLVPVGGVAPPIATISDFDDAPVVSQPRSMMQALDVPLRPPSVKRITPRRSLPPQAIAVFGGLLGLATIGTLLAVLIHRGTFATPAGPATSGSARAPRAPVTAVVTPGASASAVASAAAPEPPPEPGPWRVTELKDDESVKLVSGKLGTRSLTTALEEERIQKPQIARILKAFADDAKVFDKPKKSHQFVVAIDRASKKVKAFEYQASTTEVWQAREGDDGLLKGTKLDLKIEQRRVTRAITVTTDLKSALTEAGLDDDMLGLLDEAVSDRVPVERFGKGTVLRVTAQEQLVAGRFSKYLALDAVDYKLPRADKHVRLYGFRNGHTSGVFDAAGKAPFRSSWGPPLKVVRVTSKFNPKRMHPVLHTLMPHQGTDMGAPSGTPVYAVAAGTVSHVGPHGPSGNLVLVEHPNGLESGYAHLSRFATGIKKGDKVESQQLVGYVGSTGRSTGPHLHFSIKKNGAYIDAMTVIKLNQERVVPKADRDAFDAFRGEMDRLLDGVAVADPPPAAGDSAPDPDDSDQDKDNHDGEGEPAAAGSGSAAPPAQGEPAAAPPVSDDTKPESAVWRPD